MIKYQKKHTILDSIFDVIELSVVCGAIFFIVNIFVGQLLRITGDSMLPNYKDGEYIIAEKISIQVKPIQRGEIVIAQHPNIPNHLVVKRVIGLPQETMIISDGEIFINGKRLAESYLPNNVTTKGQQTIRDKEAFKIGRKEYVLLGDNREKSTDSRNWGAIKQEEIVGRAFFVFWPLKNIRLIH